MNLCARYNLASTFITNKIGFHQGQAWASNYQIQFTPHSSWCFWIIWWLAILLLFKALRDTIFHGNFPGSWVLNFSDFSFSVTSSSSQKIDCPRIPSLDLIIDFFLEDKPLGFPKLGDCPGWLGEHGLVDWICLTTSYCLTTAKTL